MASIARQSPRRGGAHKAISAPTHNSLVGSSPTRPTSAAFLCGSAGLISLLTSHLLVQLQTGHHHKDPYQRLVALSMKRILTASILVLSLISSSMSTASAEILTFACGSGSYKVEMPSGVLTSSIGCTGAVAIDSTVKSIGDNAFYDVLTQAKITSVSIPNSVTSIGANAFRGTNLTSVVIPNSVTSIGGSAFQDTKNLTSAILSSSLKSIGYYAFSNSGLTSVLIPQGVENIGFKSFHATQLTSVVIPDSVVVIEEDAFFLSKLNTVKFGKSLKKIGWGAFSNNDLTKIDIPDTVTEIVYSAFSGNKNLQSITYCGPAISNLPTAPTCPSDRKAIVDAANVKAAADKAAAAKAAADKAAADKAAADKAAADAIQAAKDEIQAKQDAKQLTITCKKGSISKKIRGESPKCPKGYTNPIGHLLTFKAFSECQLYKKDAPAFGAGLINSGKTLIIENPYNYRPGELFGDKPEQVSFQDLDCAFDYMGASQGVRDIYNYREVNGVRTIRWGKITLKVEVGFFGLTTYIFRQS
jgi:hypothetical protein